MPKGSIHWEFVFSQKHTMLPEQNCAVITLSHVSVFFFPWPRFCDPPLILDLESAEHKIQELSLLISANLGLIPSSFIFLLTRSLISCLPWTQVHPPKSETHSCRELENAFRFIHTLDPLTLTQTLWKGKTHSCIGEIQVQMSCCFLFNWVFNYADRRQGLWDPSRVNSAISL